MVNSPCLGSALSVFGGVQGLHVFYHQHLVSSYVRDCVVVGWTVVVVECSEVVGGPVVVGGPLIGRFVFVWKLVEVDESVVVGELLEVEGSVMVGAQLLPVLQSHRSQ